MEEDLQERIEKRRDMKTIRKILCWSPNEKIYAIGFTLILFTCLVPLYRLTQYAIPFYDDFNYSLPVWVEYKYGGYTLKAAIAGSIKNALITRNSWQGTYSSIFLMGLVPSIFGEQYYFLGPVFLITILTLSLFVFWGVIARKVFGASAWTTLALQSGMAVIVLLLIHTAQQGFYWYNGGIHYIGMFSFELLYLSLMIAILYGGKRKWLTILGVLVSLPLAFFVAGGNFITALQTPILLVTAFALAALCRNKRVLLWMPSFVIYAIGFIYSVTAPGNKVRAAFFVGRALPPVQAILKSFPDAITFAREFANWRTLLLYLLLIPVIWHLVGTEKIRFHVWGIPLVAIWSFCVYAATCTPGLYGTGANDLSRMVNLIKITFQFALLLNMIYVFGVLRSFLPKLAELKVPWFLFIGWLLVWNFFFRIAPDKIGQYSAYGAHYYHTSGEARQFYSEYEERLQALRSSQEDIVFSAYTIRPWFLGWTDLTDDPYAEPNVAMSRYYGKRSIVVIP